MSSISFERAAEYYDATRGYPHGVEEQIADAIASAAEATPATRFLELGIGTGRIAFPLIGRGYDYSGIDLSPAMMDVLRAKVTEFRAVHPEQPIHLDLREGDTTAMPYADGTFDTALTVHVLHLIPDWEKAVLEALRVLKPGGVYLNGRDEVVRSRREVHAIPTGDRSIQERWAMITEQLGHQVNRGEEARTSDLHQLLLSQGIQPERIATATWRITTTPRQTYQFIERRLWSRTWEIPDAIFAESLRILGDELQATYGNALDVPQEHEMQFIITRARKPA